MRNLVGQQLGNYRLIELLGWGGFAEVYLGEHIYLKSYAALKVLHTVLTDEEQQAFIKEAQTLVRLQHPNIVRLLDFSVQENIPFLIMDYAPGGNLRQGHPRGERLTLATIVPYVQQIAAALSYAHTLQVIHRDIKPENVLFGPQQNILLSDFGLAMLTQVPFEAYVRSRAGTLAYMAPEQLQGNPQPASDQYALGIVIYEWLSGQRPFESADFEAALLERQLPPRSLRDHLPTLPQTIDDIVQRSLMKDPQQRFATVQDFAQALTHAVENIQATTTTLSQTAQNGEIVPAQHNAVSPSQVIVQQPSMSAETPERNTTGSSDNRIQTSPNAAALVFWNLPPLSAPLVGRDSDINAICTLLRQTDIRLLTLTGTGGIGKTRLAMQIAIELRPLFRAGICFVSLAPISDPEQVIMTIARTLGLRENANSTLAEQLNDFLHEKNMLLLLDNFEQVVAAAPQVVPLLENAPQVRLLVTSRIALHLAVEQVFSVSPLTLPESAHLPDTHLAALAQVPAIKLFLQCARIIQPAFQLTTANAQTIADICTRLDGLPLAIELAAARIRLLPPHALLKRLEHQLSVLSSGSDALPSRHQTLRATVQWSYDLLTAPEQRLFRRLAVFADGFTVQATESLCRILDGDDEGTLDTLTTLIEGSLLQAPQHDEEDPRLHMLETLRAFALDALQTHDELAITQRAHALYFLELAEEARSHIAGPQEAAWLLRLERELNNLHTAMDWLLTYHKQTEDNEFALRLGIALEHFWRTNGEFRTAWFFFEQALADSTIDNQLAAAACLSAANFATHLCYYEQAQRILERGLAFYQRNADRTHIAPVLVRLGWVAHLQYHFEQAHSLYKEAITLYTALNDSSGINNVRYLLAYSYTMGGKFDEARHLYEACLAYQRTIGQPTAIAANLGDLAQLLRVSSAHPPVDEMQTLLDEALALADTTGSRHIITSIRYGLAWVAYHRGNLDEALQLVNETLEFYQQSGRQQSLGHYLELLGKIYVAQDKAQEARATLGESVRHAHKEEDCDTVLSSLIELAYLASEQQQFARALRQLAACEQLCESRHVIISPADSVHYDATFTASRTALSERVFAMLWAEGCKLSPLEALNASDTLPLQATTSKRANYPAGLTRREVDVLRLVAQGFTDAQVAEQLVISTRTVTTHLTSIYNKLNVNSRAAATNFAVKHHLV